MAIREPGMNDPTPEVAVKVAEQAPLRSPYHTPVLRLHGSLSRLTQGGAGSRFEGSSGMIGMN